MTAPACFWRSSAPPDGHSAIGLIEVRGELSAVWEALEIAPIVPGEARVRNLGGLDLALIAVWNGEAATIMPHASAVVMEQVLAWLESRGLRARGGAEGEDPREAYPEASSLLEARMLAALAVAPSARAVDLLLAQPERWKGVGRDAADDPRVAARSRVLNRLVHPPLVAAAGAPNIGKSTLLNALAKREAALVYDEAGTTRDAVGCLLELDGLVVRWLDLPGLSEHARDELDRAAQGRARGLLPAADLVVLCSDAEHDAPALGELGAPGGGATSDRVLRVGLRADLGPARGGAEVAVSARSGEGLAALARAVRQRLVPDDVLNEPGAWKFW